MSTHVDDLIGEADILRSKKDDPRVAIPLYQAACLELFEADERYAICLQQIGICYKMLRNFGQALDYLKSALEVAEPAWLIAAIRRDMADVYRQMGDLKQALDILEEVLKGINASAHTEQFGITLGWIGRIERELGHHGSALGYFRRAHELLRFANNRSYELYNLLDLADQFCKCHHPMQGRQAARKAFKLARLYGSNFEVGRAALIMLLGHDAQPIIKWVAARKGR